MTYVGRNAIKINRAVAASPLRDHHETVPGALADTLTSRQMTMVLAMFHDAHKASQAKAARDAVQDGTVYFGARAYDLAAPRELAVL